MHDALARLALVSNFAQEVLRQQPELQQRLNEPLDVLDLPQHNAPEWPRILRRWRRAQSCKLIWRDVCGLDSVEQTLHGSTWIAEQALSQSFDALLAQMKTLHGTVRNEAGIEQYMVVLGLGKLGGSELNFSSDVDLVYAFSGHGTSDGERPLAAEAYFTRLGQRLTHLLDEVSADGFSHRVDLRLRPYGASGRLLLSFAAMEQYFQSSGRDWERYAWMKARPVAGNSVAGTQFLDSIKPFVYRKYLDFTAIDGLREMKASIATEVARREKNQDIKLGRGGIREIEFYVQALQIIYGGRTHTLQLKNLLASLAQLHLDGLINTENANTLREAYIFLRRVENRVQMLDDAQRHELPSDENQLLRLANGLNFSDANALMHALEQHRACVEELFQGLLGRQDNAENNKHYSQNIDVDNLIARGFQDANKHAERFTALLNSPASRELSDRSVQRLQRVISEFCQLSEVANNPDQCLTRAAQFLQSIIKRSNYIALLDEQGSALSRVVKVFDSSVWMSSVLIEFPMLLDELLDTRLMMQHIDVQQLPNAVLAQLHAHNDDIEVQMVLLNEYKISCSFKIAYHFIFNDLSGAQASRMLAQVAENILQHVVLLSQKEIALQNGRIPNARFAMIGYGSLGARCMAINSDLDVVFLNDAPDSAISDGARPIETSRYFMRVAQKVIAFLNLGTSAGSLYEVDIRLRPDGAKGLLVSSIDAFQSYQQQRAWLWELQALVRAHAVAGDTSLCLQFAEIRQAILCAPRNSERVLQEISEMRKRMRAEMDRSSDTYYDLKHGVGGLTDIEFFLQAKLLQHAADNPDLCAPRDVDCLLQGLLRHKLISESQRNTLYSAYAAMLAESLRCHLNQAPRVVPEDLIWQSQRLAVQAVLQAHGLNF